MDDVWVSTKALDRALDDIAGQIGLIKATVDSAPNDYQISKKLKEIWHGFIIMMTREVPILPPTAGSQSGGYSPSAGEIAKYWFDKFSAYGSAALIQKGPRAGQFATDSSKRVAAKRKEVATDLERALSSVASALNYIIMHTDNWQKGQFVSTTISTLDPSRRAAYERTYVDELVRDKAVALGYIKDLRKVFRDFLLKGIASLPTEKDYAQAFKPEVELATGKKLRKGEIVVSMEPIPRGGSVAGFAVVNKVGLSKGLYHLVGELLRAARSILDGKGLGSATQSVPIIYVDDSEGVKVTVSASGQELPSAGLYWHERRVITIMFPNSDMALSASSAAYQIPFHMLGTLLHEIAHYYYYNRMSSAARSRHAEMFRRAQSFPSTYARQNEAEDFAELWTAYLGRQFYREGHSGYNLNNECWLRFKEVALMDPHLRAVGKIVAEAMEAKEWEGKLVEFVNNLDTASWVERFKETVAEGKKLDLNTVAREVVPLLRTLHSACKSNAGKFKSEAQAKFVLGSADRLAPPALVAPQKFFEGFDPAKHKAVVLPSRVSFYGSDPAKAKYTAFGFILDEAGVVTRIKFKVLAENGHGDVDYESGQVNFTRD